MIDALAFTITVGCVGGGVAVLVLALAGRYRWRRIAPTLLAVQVLLVVQAVLDAVGLVGGHRPGEPATHLAYVVTSLVVLPAAVGWAGRGDDRWTAAVVGMALVVLAVVVVRMMTTWR